MAAKLRAVKLTDVPLPVRIRAAREVCRAETNPDERHKLMATAFMPSSTTYYIAA
jgi:hypothetical protein